MTAPEITGLEALVKHFAADLDRMDVLEAGCGSLPLWIELEGDAHLVGIDISERQLARNTVVDVKILGDIQTYDFGDQRFDLVLCWDVLEHLTRPDLALSNFARVVRDGGLIVLKVPNVRSLKGLVTKLTPHAFHVWWYRHVFRYPDAGTGDRGPFRTVMRSDIAPDRLSRSARELGLVVEYLATYEDSRQTSLRERLRVTGRRWEAVRRAVAVCTRGRLHAQETELIVVLRKQ